MRSYLALIGMCLLLQNCIAENVNPAGGSLISAISGDGGHSTVQADGLKVLMINPDINHINKNTYIQSNVDSPNAKVEENSLGLGSKQI